MIKCLICSSKKIYSIYNFGKIPLVNSFNKKFEISNRKYNLSLVYCKSCKTCQLENPPHGDMLFKNYKHFSGASVDNVSHLKSLAKFIRQKFSKKSAILEIGCNDGTLMSFLDSYKFNVSGIDPAKNMSNIKIHKKCKTIFKHFGKKTELELLRKTKKKGFDLVLGVNVFAHYPSLKQSFDSVHRILSTNGIFIFEVAYALDTIFSGLYDTVYHEHVFNHTLLSLINLTKNSRLEIIFVEKINTQGVSLRIICKKSKSKINLKFKNNNFSKILKNEIKLGLNRHRYYTKLKKKINSSINEINIFLNKNIDYQNDHVLLAGAPARGVVLLNTTNIKNINKIYPIDDTKNKRKNFFPGTNAKVLDWNSKKIIKSKKAVLLSWNYKKTMIKKLKKSGFVGNLFILFPAIEHIKIK